VPFFAEGVTGAHALQSDRGGNIAGVGLGNLLALVGMHAEQAAHSLFLVPGSVEHVGAGLQPAGINPEEGQLADIRVGHNLEGQR
jgi:hypothetical protein